MNISHSRQTGEILQSQTYSIQLIKFLAHPDSRNVKSLKLTMLKRYLLYWGQDDEAAKANAGNTDGVREE